ncbi:TatD family hydrolase [Morganella morganii]|nr:TatD family hydrolase [Morganella morganii]
MLSVHSVRASKLVLDYIEEFLPLEKGKIVLHWFTGSKKKYSELSSWDAISQ